MSDNEKNSVTFNRRQRKYLVTLWLFVLAILAISLCSIGTTAEREIIPVDCFCLIGGVLLTLLGVPPGYDNADGSSKGEQ